MDSEYRVNESEGPVVSFFYKNGRTAVVDGSLVWRTDNIKAVLLDTSAYTANEETDQYLSSIPLAARISTSANLTGKTNNGGIINAEPTSFPGTAAGVTCAAMALFKDTGSAATSVLLCYIDAAAVGLPVVTDGGVINVTWNTGSDKIGVLCGDSASPSFSLLNYAGAVAVFDAADIVAADGSVVTLWANEVSGGTDLTNGDASRSPALKASVPGLHGLPALNFDLFPPRSLFSNDDTGSNPFNGTFAAYFVCLLNSLPFPFSALVSAPTNANEWTFAIDPDGKSAVYDNDNSVPLYSYSASGAQTYDTAGFVVSIRSEDGVRLRVERNGNIDVDIDPGSLNGTHKDTWQLFSSQYHGWYAKGYVAVIAIYNQIPSDLDHAVIVSQLKSRFGIA